MQNSREESSAAFKARQSATSKPTGSDIINIDRVASLLQRKRLPVFVFPDKLAFLVDEQSTHKQILTIYNPYDFLISFKVLCTAPHIYVVGDGKGLIKEHCCSDIVIRRTNFDVGFVGIVDKFRVEISHYETASLHHRRKATSSLLGTKDIPAALFHTSSEAGISFPQKANYSLQESNKFLNDCHDEQSAREFFSGHWLLISIAIVCLLALASHTTGQQDANSFIPVYISLSSNQKMVAAYILGLMTMAIFNK